ncbi:MAG TPA: TolC family protein [Bacteroidetes bacterium]|nr:TolC family protein [Bacteroidota bacterium]
MGMKKAAILLIILFGGVLNLQGQEKYWSLEECINHAIENNIMIKQQELQTQVQENTLQQSKLGLLPSLNGTATNNWSFGRALDETTYQFTEEQNVRSNQFFASAGLTLFSGLQNYNTILRNRYNVDASFQDLQNIKDDISLNVALAYLQILLNQELVTVTENQLETTREQIGKTEKMVEAGSLPRGNLLEIQAQAAREELQLINMENQLDLSYLNIVQLLELDSVDGFDIIVPEIQISEAGMITENVRDIYNTAKETRPEVLSAELRLKSSEYDLKIAKGGRSPRLNLNTSFSTGYSSIRQKILGIDPVEGVLYGEYPFSDQVNDNINYGIGLTLSIPVFNGWQVSTGISNSRINIRNSQYSLENTKKQLYKNIQQAYADAQASLKSYIASRKAVESMQESFRYTEQRFNVGMVTPVEYNTAKAQLLNAESELAQSKYEYIFKIKVLDFYKGLPLKLN